MQQRLARDWSHADLARRVRTAIQQSTGLLVNRSEIPRIEEGKVPNWAILGALSKVFTVPFQQALSLLVESIEIEGRANGPFLRELLPGSFAQATQVESFQHNGDVKSADTRISQKGTDLQRRAVAVAHLLPPAPVDAAGKEGRSLSPAGASDERINSTVATLERTASEFKDTIDGLTLLAVTLSESIARIERLTPDGETAGLVSQSPKGRRHRK